MNKVSIVIPVYNEEQRIAACLEAIAAQTIKPYEVIVVDNNSTDATVAAARNFPFVKVITAKRQGVVHARNKGFDTVRGDIIGRIDADTHVPANWVETVATIFADQEVDAVTGSVSYYDAPFPKFFALCDLKLRSRAARLMAEEVFLQGANMAMRKSAWNGIKHELCDRAGMHEDFDVAIHLSQHNYVVRFEKDLHAAISARCVDDSFANFWSYAWLNTRTYSEHDLTTGKHMLPIVVLALIFQLPFRLLHRGYNCQTGRFSLRQAFLPTEYNRVNPATFVD